MIIMLIYTLNKRNSTRKITLPIETSELKSLKLIMKTLNEFQTSAFRTNYTSFDGFNLENEDIEAHYITSIKRLLRTVEPNTLSTLYSITRTDFPILKPLLKYSLHSDVMIRNAARISLMSIIQKCQSRTMEYIVFVAICNHINDILNQVKRAALDMQNSYAKSNAAAMKNALQYYQEELEYIDDILNLNKAKAIVISKVINGFIIPFIFTAIMDKTIEYLSPISSRIGLCLLSKLLESITDFEMKESIVRIILKKETIPVDIKFKNQQINRSLLLVLVKHKTSIDTLLVLNIVHKLQVFILEINNSIGQFYHTYFFALMKLLKTKYQSSTYTECFKLKLLIPIFQLLIKSYTASDSNFAKIKYLFWQNLKILYDEISAKIQQKIDIIVDIIDEEYEAFYNIDKSNNFNDLKYFFVDHKIVNNIRDDTKIDLYYLFCIRFLYLEFEREKEKNLPIIRKKEEIGKTVAIDASSLPCEKFIGNIFYHKEHFLKITDRQLLILQRIENKTDGIIIFNSYYKDVIWSSYKNNTLKLCDTANSSSSQYKISPKPFFIEIKLANTDDLEFVIDILSKAKESQIKTVRRKLEEILLIRKNASFDTGVI